ncbi:MAG: methionine adenosyltransferase [Clostridia bacterium]|nr:methionine adenosyltransferase [Clostridia bacterium]
MSRYYFTSESVTEGHPDKVCDQISDAVLDTIIAQDPNARVACETFCTTQKVVVMGEITTSASFNVENIVRGVVFDIGYNIPDIGFDCKECDVTSFINEQSADISGGVGNSLESRENSDCDIADTIGAGDQGMMFGFACDETEEYMPLTTALAQELALKLSKVRKDGTLPYLRPDGKTQVTVEYEDGVPVRIDTIVISTQHSEDVTQEQLKVDLIENVVNAVVPKNLIDENTKYLINPSGRFVIGGPAGDTGLTGRKIIVDTYGGVARHGGGAFSGKDPTKVDRSAAYAARYVAKNVVAAGLAKRCELQLAYAIGVASPVSIYVDTFGTETVDKALIEDAIKSVFDLRPYSIIKDLGLRNPIYRDTAAYGHFGRKDVEFSWEKTDKISALKEYISKNS